MSYHCLSSQNLWGEDKFKWTRFVGLGIWYTSSSGHQNIEEQVLQMDNLDVWLKGPPNKKDYNGIQWTRLYQMVIASDDGKKIPRSSPEKCLSALLSHSQLQFAFDFAMSYPAGISALPFQAAGGDEVHTYTLANHPKLAFLWKHVIPRAPECYGTTFKNEEADITELVSVKPGGYTFGIVFVDSKEYENLSKLIHRQWSTNLVSHPMFSAFISSLHLNFRIDKIHQHIKTETRRVEARTGHHCFNSLQQFPAPGDLRELLATMSGFATKLAGTSRKMEFLREVYQFIHTQMDSKYDGHKSNLIEGEERRDCMDMGQQVKLMQHRLAMQRLESDFILARVEVQMNAMFHLTSQQDSVNGIHIANATQATAVVSLQESSFMKILTLMAVTFLPGNFVAALFSASLFGSETAANMITIANKPLFALFWIITIPLTLFICIVVVVCVFIQNRNTQKKIRVAQDQLTNRSQERRTS
ncbi:unnamed protein product [Clonostachys byssicola]|uniref:Uncharacterized protein n=1 Tax=Clonostachys byssicola TaxID=160290 RepID=A0A9N9TZJ5_9HYPO|nr:unnamed protein product [Clonostachys byssicola]